MPCHDRRFRREFLKFNFALLKLNFALLKFNLAFTKLKHTPLSLNPTIQMKPKDVTF